MAKSAIQEVKFFACLLETRLKLLRVQLRQVMRRRGYHKESRIRSGELWIDKEVQRAFVLSDEFLSYRLESILISLNELMESGSEMVWCQGF